MSASLRSGLYPGIVRHRRQGRVDHALRARVVMALFDLDELDVLDRTVIGFGNDRPAPVQFRAADHGPADGSDLRAWLHAVTADHDIDVRGPTRVLCMPRVLGFAFDPLSVWFCHDLNGALSAIVHEVRNTFGGRHAYVVADPMASAGPRKVVTHTAAKAFHVSPFFDVDGHYDFTVRVPDDHVAIGIDHTAGDGHMLSASFVGRRVPFTSGALWRLMASHPLLPQRVLAQIHVHAAALWAKGARYRPVPDEQSPVTMAHPRAPSRRRGPHTAKDVP